MGEGLPAALDVGTVRCLQLSGDCKLQIEAAVRSGLPLRGVAGEAEYQGCQVAVHSAAWRSVTVSHAMAG